MSRWHHKSTFDPMPGGHNSRVLPHGRTLLERNRHPVRGMGTTIRWMLAAALACGLMMRDADASTTTDSENTHEIEIPAQSLANALQALASQTGIEIVFFSDAVAGLRVGTVEGNYSTRQVLNLLLEDTSLDFDALEGGGIVIYQAPTAEPHADGTLTREVGEYLVDHPLSPLGDDHSGASTPGGKSSDGGGIFTEEIIVTGGLPDIASMDSPRSTTIIPGDLIGDMNARSITDIYTIVPGLNVRNMQEGEHRYNIRGITSQTGIDGYAPIRPTTSVYLDGMPVTSALGPHTQTAGPLFDIDHIKVLKGPQGTSLGESSLAGSVRYVYKQPDTDQFAAAVNASISDMSATNEASSHADAMINLPLAPGTALRLAGWQTEEAGFVDNFTPLMLNINDREGHGGRIALKHDTGRVAITGSMYYSNQETLGSSGTAGPYVSLSEHLPGKPTFSRDEMTIYSLDAEVNLGWAMFLSTTSFASRSFGANTETTRDARTRIDFVWGGTFVVEDLSRCHLFDPCPDFPGLFNIFDPDGSSTIGDGMNLRHLSEIADHSSERRVQEFHLVSPSDKALRWTLGLFWNDGEDINSDIADALYYHGREDTFGSLFDAISASPHNNHTDSIREHAAFGEIHYDITDHWGASMGLRYSNISQSFTVANRRTKDTPLTGKIVLSWRPYHDLLTYLSLATGHRPGNVNGHMEFVADLYAQQLEKAQTTGNTHAVEHLTHLHSQSLSHRFFDGDRVIHYEVGAKMMPLDGGMRFIIAAYFVEWENMIVLEQDPYLLDHIPPLSSFNINSGGAEIWGIELDVNAELSDHLSMRFTADTNGSKITEGPLWGNTATRTLNPTPKWTASLAMNYTRPLENGWTLRSHWNHAHVGEQGDIHRHHKTDGRIVLHSPGGQWRLALFANNLTDEKLISDVQSQTLWWYNPRQVGLEIGYGH